jgi:signal transduction histidine kinase
MTISIAFSVVIYEFLSHEVNRFSKMQSARFESRIKNCVPTPTQPCLVPIEVLVPWDDSELVLETKRRIINSLIFINGSILVISGGLGYFLAGITLKPIKDMVEDQNRFISDASHELKTPLTSLKTAFEVHLRNNKRTLQEAEELVDESILEVNKLQRLSESLLQLAGYQKYHQSPILEPVDLPTVIADAIKSVKPLAKNKRITIKKTIADAQIFANKDSFTDLLVILLDNAIKYSDKNTEITVTANKVDKHYVEIAIRDQGIGISKDELEHIYERFYRSDSARTKNQTSGYGLGLAIAHQIATVHKTSISVTSKKNSGSTFSLKIALAPSSKI